MYVIMQAYKYHQNAFTPRFNGRINYTHVCLIQQTETVMQFSNLKLQKAKRSKLCGISTGTSGKENVKSKIIHHAANNRQRT